MNIVTPCSRASAASRRWTSAGISSGTACPRWLGTAGRGRSDGQRQLRRRPGQRLPPVADLLRQQAARITVVAQQLPLPHARSRRTAPAAAPSPEPGPAAARHTPPPGPGRRPRGPAVGGDVVQHQHQHVHSGAARSSRARTGTCCAARSNGSCRDACATAPGRSSSLVSTISSRQPSSSRPQDPLVRLTVRHREHGPQHLVPGDHVPQRRLERARCRGSPSAAPRRDVVAAEAGLRAGRGTTAAAGRTTTAPAPAASPGRSGSRAGRPPASTAASPATVGPRTAPAPRISTRAPPGPATQPDRQQRVPAQREEVVVRPDPSTPSTLGEHRRTAAPRPPSPGPGPRQSARSPARAARPGPASRWASAAAPPAPRPRPAPCTPAAATRHARAPPRPAVSPGPAGRDHVGDQPPLPGDVLPDDHRGLGDRRCSRSTASTSPGSIRNPRTLTCSSARPTNTSCPSAVHLARSPVRYIRSPGPERARHEPLPGQPGPAQIAPRQPRPGRRTARRPPRPAPGPARSSSTNTRVLAIGAPISDLPRIRQRRRTPPPPPSPRSARTR